MKRILRLFPGKIIIVCILLGVLVSTGTVFGAKSINFRFMNAKPGNKSVNNGKKIVVGQVIVKFKKNTSYQTRVNKSYSIGARRLGEFGKNREFSLIKLHDGQRVHDIVKAFRDDPAVEHIQPNYIYRTTKIPGDTKYGGQWGLKNSGQVVSDQNGYKSYHANNPGSANRDMALEPVWDLITDCTANNVVVAVLDTGVQYNHPDLIPNMWNDGAGNPGKDFIENNNISNPTESNTPLDENGHGTHVAGIIGAEGREGPGGAGTVGVCWKAKIMAVRVLNHRGEGSTATIVNGIKYAINTLSPAYAANGARIINMSLGRVSDPDFPENDEAMRLAIEEARAHDVMVVTSAGNNGENNDTTTFYPCNFNLDNNICVAALDQSYRLATFSNYGATTVHIGAPGTNILSTWAYKWVIREDFNDNGTLDWNVVSGGVGSLWAYQSYAGYDWLVLPSNFDAQSAYYESDTLRTVHKQFDMTGKYNIRLQYFLFGEMEWLHDYMSVYYRVSAGDPSSGTQLARYEGALFNVFFEVDRTYSPHVLTNCTNSSICNIGFKFGSNSTVNFRGVAIGDLVLTTSDYATVENEGHLAIDGTSMSSPHVAGLAAILFSYNHQYAYSDVIAAIIRGGTALPDSSDRSKLASGMAANAWGSLKYINKPTGLTAAKAP